MSMFNTQRGREYNPNNPDLHGNLSPRQQEEDDNIIKEARRKAFVHFFSTIFNQIGIPSDEIGRELRAKLLRTISLLPDGASVNHIKNSLSTAIADFKQCQTDMGDLQGKKIDFLPLVTGILTYQKDSDAEPVPRNTVSDRAHDFLEYFLNMEIANSDDELPDDFTGKIKEQIRKLNPNPNLDKVAEAIRIAIADYYFSADAEHDRFVIADQDAFVDFFAYETWLFLNQKEGDRGIPQETKVRTTWEGFLKIFGVSGNS